MTDTIMNTGAASLSECDFVAVPRAAVEWLKEHYPALTEKAGMCERIGKRLYTKTTLTTPTPQADAAIAAGGAQEAVGEILREGNDSAFKVSWLRPPGPNGTKLYAADPKAAATVAPTDARYIVIGYGETDHPQAAFINEREQLLDAVLGMMYTHASDADPEIREAYAKDLTDDDEWSEGIWSTEFEIGGITIYDLGYGSAASNGEQA